MLSHISPRSTGHIPLSAPVEGSYLNVIAGNGTVAIAGEGKTADPDNGNVYVRAEKVDDLCVFAKAFQMVPVIFIRWDQNTTWYWAEPSDIPVTESDNYRVNPTVSIEEWRTLDVLASGLEGG